jgi:Tfp pilus assembly protein PilV
MAATFIGERAMRQHRPAGFTIVEVLVAGLVLVAGVAVLAASSGLSTRMIGRGRMATVAVSVAQARLDRLRSAALSSPVACAAGAGADGFASSPVPVATQGVTESWSVSGAGATRDLEAVVRYPVAGGERAETLRTRIPCPAS